MSEKITAREELEEILYGIARKIDKIRVKYFPTEVLFEYIGLTERLRVLEDDLRNLTDDELEKLRYYECVILPKCPIAEEVPDEIPDDWLEHSEPLKELCKNADCPKFERCWSRYSLVPPIEDLSTPQWETDLAQKDWSEFRKNLYNLGEPTPSFGDKEKDEEFYRDLEKRYKKRGEY